MSNTSGNVVANKKSLNSIFMFTVHAHSLCQTVLTRAHLQWSRVVPAPALSTFLSCFSQAATFSSFSYFFWYLPLLFLSNMPTLIFFFYFKYSLRISYCKSWGIAILDPFFLSTEIYAFPPNKLYNSVFNYYIIKYCLWLSHIAYYFFLVKLCFPVALRFALLFA